MRIGLKTRLKAYFAMLNAKPEVEVIRRGLMPGGEGRATPLWVHLALFLVTFATTTFAGSGGGRTFLEIMLSGLPFSVTIMTILLSHEMGHYLAARRFGVKATLPYFIPFPSLIGTMGAVIKIKSPIRDRRALLYIGAMGPAVGFTLSLAAAIVGLYLSDVKPLPASPDQSIPVFGDSILFRLLTLLIHGPMPPGYDIYLSPYAWAGWIGFLVTSLNLMPMGQLDGSHILYALIGRKQLFAGWTAFAGLCVLSVIWPGWALWIFMALFFLMIGHPPVEDGGGLSPAEKMFGWCCVAIFFLTFIPVPVDFV